MNDSLSKGINCQVVLSHLAQNKLTSFHQRVYPESFVTVMMHKYAEVLTWLVVHQVTDQQSTFIYNAHVNKHFNTVY